MLEPVQKCTYCGANLTLDDLRKPNCPYCSTVYPHRAQAAQHAEMAGQVMNQMMAQQAQIQNAWRAGFGVGPMPTGMPGGPPPGMPLPPGAPGSPYADPQRMMAVQMANVSRMSRTIVLVIVLSTVAVLLMVAGILGAVYTMR